MKLFALKFAKLSQKKKKIAKLLLQQKLADLTLTENG